MALTKEAGARLWVSRWPDWVRRAKERHQDRYSYPSHEKVGQKIRVVCPEHGEFLQLPAKHMHGQGCPKCSGHGSDKMPAIRARYTDWDWSGVKLGLTKDDLHLNCPEHGAFVTTVNSLLTRPSGSTTPCPSCARRVGGLKARVSPDEWVERVNKAHHGNVVLDPSSVTTSVNKARFTCKHHGLFESVLNDVASGHGCPTCGEQVRLERLRSAIKVTQEEMLESARLVHGDKYEYDLSTYTDQKTSMRIICRTHGEFWQIPRNHLSLKAGCPRCSTHVSKGEDEVAEFLSRFTRVVRRDRQTIGKEIDILLPDLKVGVEYCGVFWHGEKHKDKEYHQKKTLDAMAAGIKLLTIFEDEWLSQREKVEARLKLEVSTVERVYARKTRVEEISWTAARAFLEVFHLQGAGRPGKAHHALVSDRGVVAVAVWGADRFGTGEALELYRFCSRGDLVVVGGLSKLVAHAEKTLKPRKLLSYADLRWGTGAAYANAGFVQDGVTPPGYTWCRSDGARRSRHSFQKHKLKDVLKEFDERLTEVENCHRNGWWRVWDSGHARWVKWLHGQSGDTIT